MPHPQLPPFPTEDLRALLLAHPPADPKDPWWIQTVDAALTVAEELWSILQPLPAQGHPPAVPRHALTMCLAGIILFSSRPVDLDWEARDFAENLTVLLTHGGLGKRPAV